MVTLSLDNNMVVARLLKKFKTGNLKLENWTVNAFKTGMVHISE